MDQGMENLKEHEMETTVYMGVYGCKGMCKVGPPRLTFAEPSVHVSHNMLVSLYGIAQAAPNGRPFKSKP